MGWKGRRVLVVGAARQGIALARYLVGSGAQVTLNDMAPPEELEGARKSLAGLSLNWVTGGHPLNLLDNVDLICPSGGVPLSLPLLREAARRGIPLSNDSQIFLEETSSKVIGITGSAGKTTTTALVGQIATIASREEDLESPRIGKMAQGKVWVGGNIGNPLISDVGKMKPADLVVMELSSFQLELMSRSPQIAAILNITPNHLDRHVTMSAYTKAKSRIIRFQGADDWAVICRDDLGAWEIHSEVKGQLIVFSRTEPDTSTAAVFVRDDHIMLRAENREVTLLPVSAIRLRGEHNLHNVLAACAAAYAAELPVTAMRQAVGQFTGLPHRLEFVRRWKGASWFNDSIATAPERTIAALRSFNAPIILLAGGRDKDLPWEDCAEEVHRRVEHLIVFGEAAPIILEALGNTKQGQNPLTVTRCESLAEAVVEAERLTQPGYVVLLAPGGTSFDEFRDFEERGEWYKRWVNARS